MALFKQLLVISSGDPEDARRRKLLNILLLGVLAVDLLAVVVTGLMILTGIAHADLEVLLIIVGGLVMLGGITVIYLINHYHSGPLGAVLFLLLLTLIFTFSDVPHEVANGRSLFLFTVPIIMASVLLRPASSFFFAALSSAIISALAIIELDLIPNIPGIIGFIVVALVSWLSARSLERALVDLRAINRELDQRVIARTQDLADALARVQAESSKNQAILESIADGVIVFDTEGRVIVANYAIADLLGHAPQAAVGQHVEALIGDALRSEDRATLIRFVCDEHDHYMPVKFIWGSKTLSVSFAAVRDEKSQVTGTVVVFRDYTREAEVERMKSMFVSMASHELRTPLNAILGYGDILNEEIDGPLNGEQTNTVRRIIANGGRMLGLVNNLLDQAAIEAGRITMNPSSFDPRALIADIHAMMGVLAEQKHLVFECTVDEAIPPALVSDPHRLQQILVNLVGNAVKFTDRGYIAVRVKRQDDAHWTLEVEDTGAGIPHTAQSYIFEPFRQVDDPLTRHHSGSGLGLSIVKQLVNLLGGDIVLVSKVGAGSTFTVTLPLTLEQEPAA